MRKIKVLALSTVEVEGHLSYNGHGRPREMSKISVALSDVECSCKVEDLDSRYVSLESETVYGEASSFFDRAVERGLSLMVDGESAFMTVFLPKKFISVDMLEDLQFTCKAHLKILDQWKTSYDTSVEDKLMLACKYKNMAVDLYKKGSGVNQMSAYLFFTQAIKWLSMLDPKEWEGKKAPQVETLKMQCYNNIGLYHLQRKHFACVVSAVSKALEFDRCNVKAFYRRAVANTELQNYEEAENDLLTALKLDPSNVLVQKQQEELRKRQKVISDKYAVAMKKFFS